MALEMMQIQPINLFQFQTLDALGHIYLFNLHVIVVLSPPTLEESVVRWKL